MGAAVFSPQEIKYAKFHTISKYRRHASGPFYRKVDQFLSIAPHLYHHEELKAF
jgi:hypothetical protein